MTQRKNSPWARAFILAGASNPNAMVMQEGNKIAIIGGGISKCPRCGSDMGEVKLSANSDRTILYCPRDRVTIPLPVKG